jgi:chromosome segregation ATPase
LLASLQAELDEMKDEMKDLDTQIAELSAAQDEASDEIAESDETTSSDESEDSDELTDEDIAQFSPAMKAWLKKGNDAAVARLHAHQAADAQAEKEAKSSVLQSIALAGITLGGIFGTALAIGKDKDKKKAW